MSTSTTTVPKVSDDVSADLDGMYEVILYNDDYNSVEHVVKCLMVVFGHGLRLAVKIMAEAHHRGRAIAEVEGKEPAQLHCEQLKSFGLTASVQKI
jgi:ATP-dependent Clp protease adaptor protein ClpS